MKVKTQDEIKIILSEIYVFFGKILSSGQKTVLTAEQECYLYKLHIDINNYAKSVNQNSPTYSVFTDFFKERFKSDLKSIDDFAFDFGFIDKR